MSYSKHDRQLQIAQSRGKDVGGVFVNKPESDAEINSLIKAYNVLARSRNGAITLSEIKAYSEMFTMIVPIQDFVDIIQTIDGIITG